MNKALSLALLIVGVILLVFGINASESLTSEFSEAFTGSPSNRSIWLIALGIIGTLVGAIGLIRRRA